MKPWALLLLLAWGAMGHAQEAESGRLLTPVLTFEHNSFTRCTSNLADLAMVWEEEMHYEGTAQSGLSVETCSSLSSTMYSFTDAKGEEDPEAWTRTWVQWLEAMREAGVPEAAEILEAWVAEGRPVAFDHFYETHGGHALHAEPGRFTLEFYSAL